MCVNARCLVSVVIYVLLVEVRRSLCLVHCALRVVCCPKCGACYALVVVCCVLSLCAITCILSSLWFVVRCLCFV